ncbi:hypothetical protein SIO70_10170 [Chitinophaga sancti]|uniref:hypothetical protein n=1 Tax=Chitinophaga sancti TaxID=1004 RepID=UPI002A74D3BD|nr:hypothetical protein [Chitinophaga sancti]WPQ65209.1 hypothetical protein SIO70_10170 [Chitinophaga sancti]
MNTNNGEFINAVKGNVAFYLPQLFEFIPESESFWNDADKRFKNKIQERLTLAAGENIQVEITIFDIIFLVKQGNIEAFRFLNFVRKMFSHLFNNLQPDERTMVKKTFKTILKKLDLSYINFVGELAVLNNIMSTKKYRLETVEASLTDSLNTIDFKVRDLKTNESHLVEVVNIHIDSDKVQTNPELIKAFFTHRLSKKLKSKQTQLPFELITVLWGKWQDFKVYTDYFKQYPMHLDNVREPMAYLTFTETDNGSKFENRFMRISRLFDEKWQTSGESNEDSKQH